MPRKQQNKASKMATFLKQSKLETTSSLYKCHNVQLLYATEYNIG